MAVRASLQPHVHGDPLSAGTEDEGLDAFARRLGHAFREPMLLVEALTHPSVSGQKRRIAKHGYERLEFLGDRVLGLVIAEWLLERFPKEAEGAIAKRHVALVRREALVDVARAIGLGRHLVLSPGEEVVGRENPTILADACEAVIGALYRDGGLAAASGFIRRAWAGFIDRQAAPPQDPKSALQQWALARGLKLPRYVEVSRGGSDHLPVFEIRVEIEGQPAATASGPSKRVAERDAAAALLQRLSS
ncbi:ribonuclease III [Inquilinus sp. Marseille-Q2685]|uniref:ribonuclease III n=1 Tax=Inquilinus sp. Marseille-Q2685 TaxID=2866581 RepID=UPI001CE3C583|nr:ribonuclease III [Inquilinus sp. Marseille-Q2685]